MIGGGTNAARAMVDNTYAQVRETKTPGTRELHQPEVSRSSTGR